jgi:hypothetical protein
MPDSKRNLRDEVTERYLAVNGSHPMTTADDSYVNEYFKSLEALAEEQGIEPDVIRRLMLAELLPLPSYLHSDGTQMVPIDLLDLGQAAGGLEHLPRWFQEQFDDPEVAAEEWEAYLSGQYVCLRHVSPATIRRKDALCSAIEELLDAPRPESAEWLLALHELIDELDALEPPFAAYDRLRFGGAVSRDRLITDLRSKFPRWGGKPRAVMSAGVRAA